MLYDATVSIDQEAEKGQISELEEKLETNELIDAFIKVKDSPVKIKFKEKEKSLTMIVPENTSAMGAFIKFRSRVGHKEYELNDNGVILTEQVANKLGVKAGDMVTMKEGDREAQVKVSAISENYMSHYIYLSPSLYQTLFGETVEFNEYFLLFPGMEENQELQVGNELLNEPSVSGIFYISYFRNLLDNILVSLNIVVWVLIIAAGALAFVVLYNLNNININERRRELATIKVLGFYNNELGAYVYRENVILTIIGSLFGILFGIILHRFVIITVEIELVMFGRTIDFSSYLYSILLTFLFSAFVNFVMFFKLKKIDMVESLKSVE
jgi:putative ABC transport system permease protein